MFSEFVQLRDDWFNNVLDNLKSGNSLETDVIETKETIEILANLPGFEKKDVVVSFENSILEIKAQRNNEKSKDIKYLIKEIPDNKVLQRSFKLYSLVDDSSIKAELKDGVLRVSLHKRINPSKQIEIN